jgi:hypothetical protein
MPVSSDCYATVSRGTIVGYATCLTHLMSQLRSFILKVLVFKKYGGLFMKIYQAAKNISKN